jgi:hypothetical protein
MHHRSDRRGEKDGEQYRSPQYGTHYVIIVLIYQSYPGDKSCMEEEARQGMAIENRRTMTVEEFEGATGEA